MANGEDVTRIYDDTTAGDNGPPAGGKRQLIREGGSASRVSIHARPRDPGGGTVSTDPPRRTILDDVSVAVEQPGEEPPLVSSGCSTVRTERASAEDTHRRECPHDVVGLHAHKGTMWMSSDCVPLKNVESPHGGGVSPLSVLPEVLLRQCFQLCLPCLPRDLSWVRGRMKSCGSMRPLQGFFQTRFSL